MRYAMAIDTKKCVGCSDCVVACQTENDVPIGYCRDWIVEVTDGTYPQLEIELRSERCNHCDNSPCVRCCPTGASHYEKGGIVMVTHHKCIGCGPVLPVVRTMRVIRTLKVMSINARFVCTASKKGFSLPA
jgi:Fe-S-cluster-containing dehydrogenase component